MGDNAGFLRGQGGAHEIGWRAWGPLAFGEAATADRPIFLNVSTVWCQSCRWMDETTFSDASIIALIGQEFVPIRVDGDRYPHVQERYVAGGWPTNAFLTPTGEVLWASTFTEPSALLDAANGVLDAWRQRRSEFQHEIERRRRALEASRMRQPSLGLVRRDAADDVLTALRDGFDTRNGGFGTAPKFPSPRAIELLYRHGRRDPACAIMADRTLDGMIAGELFDHASGGFFRYTLGGDWTSPRFEKLLDVNAALLDVYSLGALLRERRDWRDVAEQTVGWADHVLLQPEGLWGGSQVPDETYFELDGEARHRVGPPPTDATLYSSWNLQWIAALANAGSRLGRDDWVERSESALAALLDSMAAPDGLLFHYRAPDASPALPILLTDPLHAGIACIAVARATANEDWIDRARALEAAIERAFWAEDGGFHDRLRTDHDIGVLRYRDRPFELNAEAARFLLDLGSVSGTRRHRALAERTLALLSPRAGRYGVDGAGFALAVEQFFDTPSHGGWREPVLTVEL